MILGMSVETFTFIHVVLSLVCIMTGFIDQLCVRRNMGTLECDLTEGRTGTLMRESAVQNSQFFVTANIRELWLEGNAS